MGHFERQVIIILTFIIGIFLSNVKILAAEYTVSSDDEFNDLALVAGDVVTWLDGTYTDQQIRWNGPTGTESAPIILKAQTPGGVIFKGDSRINFFGSYLIVDGFFWQGGEGASNHIEFRRNGSNTDFGMNCTIRNCVFDNLVTPEPDKSRWIVLYGSGNVVEKCSFINKLSAGALILVELDYNQNLTPGHIIRNNYFYNITPKDGFATNSGDCETIRIGVSSDQAISAQVTVEGNYFQAADGENEIITNKSADNVFKHNTFRNCRGSLVLRHGAGAYIEGNFFLGEGKPKSGGIRISDRDHVIINNYMQGLNNDNDIWNNGITLVGGGENSGGTGNGYQNVDNVVIAHNTIYDSDDPIFFNDQNAYDPTGIIAYNLVYSENGDLVAGDISGTGQGMTYEGNIFGGSNIGITSSGITTGNANFEAYGELFRPSSTGIAADAAGNAYSSIVNIDVEGVIRPNTDLDVGAHEVSGGTGSVVYSPITDGDVGAKVGACFLDAAGNVLSECGAVGDYLTVSQVSDFTDLGGTKSASVSSNIDWTVSKDQDWIEVSPASGSGSGKIDITVSVNEATVDRTGIITVSGEGVDDRTIQITQLAYVAPIEVTGVSLNPDTIAVAVSGTHQLIVTVFPNDASNQKVSFSSDNMTIATVDEVGLVTAVAAGTATITVTTEDGGYEATSFVKVLSPSSEFNWALNQPVTATGTHDGDNEVANLVDGDVVSRWSVSGFPQTATLDLGADITINQIEVICYNDRAYQYEILGSLEENGTFTEIVDRSANSTPGAAGAPIIDLVSDITARYLKVTVTGADLYDGDWVSLTELRVFGEGERADILVSGVSLSRSSLDMNEGETHQLLATIEPSNATNKEVSFSSSDATIASVDASGLVKALSEGTADIKVTSEDGGFSDMVLVQVTSTKEVLSAKTSRLAIYPNPAQNHIILPDHLNGAYVVMDMSGRKILTGLMDSRTLNVDQLKAGAYFVVVGEQRLRFIKQ
ncbi:MAG: Ig-like domain-containing protein [Cyclobacteriaceae bacterium]